MATTTDTPTLAASTTTVTTGIAAPIASDPGGRHAMAVRITNEAELRAWVDELAKRPTYLRAAKHRARRDGTPRTEILKAAHQLTLRSFTSRGRLPCYRADIESRFAELVAGANGVNTIAGLGRLLGKFMRSERAWVASNEGDNADEVLAMATELVLRQFGDKIGSGYSEAHLLSIYRSHLRWSATDRANADNRRGVGRPAGIGNESSNDDGAGTSLSKLDKPDTRDMDELEDWMSREADLADLAASLQSRTPIVRHDLLDLTGVRIDHVLIRAIKLEALNQLEARTSQDRVANARTRVGLDDGGPCVAFDGNGPAGTSRENQFLELIESITMVYAPTVATDLANTQTQRVGRYYKELRSQLANDEAQA